MKQGSRLISRVEIKSKRILDGMEHQGFTNKNECQLVMCARAISHDQCLGTKWKKICIYVTS